MINRRNMVLGLPLSLIPLKFETKDEETVLKVKVELDTTEAEAKLKALEEKMDKLSQDNSIYLWKLGDLDKGILPTSIAVQKLRNALMQKIEGERLDLVWGPELNCEVIGDGEHFVQELDGRYTKVEKDV